MSSLKSETVSPDGSRVIRDTRRSLRSVGLMAVAVALFAFIPSADDALAEGGFPTGVAAPTSTETCGSSPRVDGLAPGVKPPAWAEHEFVHFFMRPQTSEACLSAGVAGEHGETLQYQGGPVQHSPQLYLLFWGSNFESSVGLRLSEAFHLFYGNLKSENEVKGSTAVWQGIVDQYWSNEGPFYHNAKIAAEGHITSVTAPKNVTYALLDKTISEWVESIKTNYHLTPNQNAQFVVLTAPGSTFNKEVLPEEEKEGKKYVTCGFHKTTGPYTGEHKDEFYSYSLVPYNGDSGCGGEGTKTETEEEKLINGTTDTASHEFAEAVTDPNSSREYATGETDPYTSSFGWTGKGGNEIADECETKSGARLPYRSWVTLLWDDLGGYEKGSPEGECKLEDPPYAAPSAPSATTEGATGITTTEATVAGSVNPNGPDAHYYFEYGPTTSYGTKIPASPGNDAGFGTKAVPVSVKITGLQVGTIYHYRLVASSWVGTTNGADHTFTTSAKGTLTAGAYHTCALLAARSLKCWGENYYGQLGNGTNKNISTTPVAVSGITNATEVAAGGYHTCALLSTKGIDCWGYNKYGELGDDTKQERTTPVAVSGITNAIQVSSGGFHTCAVLSTGKIDCWGENAFEQLGDGTSENSLTPVAVSGISTATSVTAGGLGTCATLSGGKVDCWGYGEFGELGNGKTENSSTPVEVKGISNAVAVTAVGDFQACARLSTGTIDCWGDNEDGELGDGKTENSSIPVAVSGITTATGVTAGAFHTCGLLSAGGLDCWGENYFGELGNGTTNNSSTPVTVSGISTATLVVAGTSHTCGRLSGGKADCWGENYDGQLGNGTTTNSTTPVAVTGLP